MPTTPAVVRTPDERFGDLPGFAYAPRYVEVFDKRLGPLRMHYVDEGPRSGELVLLLHGQPTWSYLWRHVIAGLVAAGRRVVACDHVGFGRSDKPTERTAYSFAGHVRHLAAFVEQLELNEITLVAQDWGGPIGLSVLAGAPERFARVVVANTILHTVEAELAGRLAWADHGIDGGRVVLQEALVDYVVGTQRAHELRPSAFVDAATASVLAPEVLAAYDAPFPDEDHLAGVRQFPLLVPLTRNDPGAALGRTAWAALAAFRGPLLTAYADGDDSTRGWAELFQERVPGATGREHVVLAGAGHFLQEDRGPELADAVDRFMAATPLR